MRIRCPDCQQPVPTEDVNVQRLLAKCRGCARLFSFESQLEGGNDAAPPVTVAPVPLPPGLVVLRDEVPAGAESYRAARPHPGGLTITRRWFAPQSLFLLFFGLVWCAFLVFWYASVTATGAPWIFFVFPLLHVAVGIGVLYGAITGLVNRTVVRVADGKLTIRHGPLPARGNREIPIEELRQLYTEQKVSSKGARSYALHAVVETGPTLVLLQDLPDAQQALFLERTLEDHLRIEDRPVPGAFVG